MKYKYMIFDVDGTLLDFSLAYARSQRAVAEKLQVPFSEEYIRKDDELGWRIWGEFGLDDVENEDVQNRYHDLYTLYLEKHFSSLAEEFGVAIAVEDVVDTYSESLGSSKEPMEACTYEVFEELSRSHKLIIATNGIGKIQRARLEGFLPLTSGIYISEEIGAIKPSRAFFDRILTDLKCSPTECLMIGDSISSDIVGAKNAGISTCWYNCKQRPASKEAFIDYEITSIKDLLSLGY